MDMPAQLVGRRVRLEPLEDRHVAGLVAAGQVDPSLYTWTVIPRTIAEARDYVRTAVEWRDAERAVPFAVIRLADGELVGSTRFFDLERLPWPAAHARHGRISPDVGEIGYSWLAASAVGTGVNVEMKRLMLEYAFEHWGVERICFHTDARNERSRRALERIGTRFEGVLRAHRLAADGTFRNSARYSIVAAEWPGVKALLDDRLERYGSG